MSESTVLRQPKNLKKIFFVRMGLDESRVQTFVDLIKAGEKMDPVLITPENGVIDGRHRIAAYERLSKKVPCHIVRDKSMAEMIIMAAKANDTDGPLPMTRRDYEHTIALLMQEGVTKQGDLCQALSFLPPSYVRDMAAAARLRLSRDRMDAAKRDVGKGLTIEEAAAKNKVDLAALRRAITGGSGGANTRIELLRIVGQRFQTFGISNGKMLKKIFEDLEDGEISAADAWAVVKKMEQLFHRGYKNFQDHTVRIGVVVESKGVKIAEVGPHRRKPRSTKVA